MSSDKVKRSDIITDLVPKLGGDKRVKFYDLGRAGALRMFEATVDEGGIERVVLHNGSIHFRDARGRNVRDAISVLQSRGECFIEQSLNCSVKKGKVIVTGEVRVEKNEVWWEDSVTIPVKIFD